MAKKQIEMKGMERPVIKEIENAAEEYVEIRDNRMALTEKEVVAKQKLLDVMTKHKAKLQGEENTLKYRYDGRIIEVRPTESVKVRKAVDEFGAE